jgi:hypothetical protein
MERLQMPHRAGFDAKVYEQIRALKIDTLVAAQKWPTDVER